MTETPIAAAQQPDNRVGSLVFLSVPHEHVPAKRLAELLAEHGLTGAVDLPSTMSAEDAFTYGCRRKGPWAQYTISQSADGATTEPVDVRLAIVSPELPDERLYHLVRHWADHEGGHSMTLAQIKVPADQVSAWAGQKQPPLFPDVNEDWVARLSADEQDRVEAELRRMFAAYHAALDLLHPGALTSVIHQILVAAGGICPTRRPGAYFVPRSGDSAIKAVRHILSELAPSRDTINIAVSPVTAADHGILAMATNAARQTISDKNRCLNAELATYAGRRMPPTANLRTTQLRSELDQLRTRYEPLLSIADAAPTTPNQLQDEVDALQAVVTAVLQADPRVPGYLIFRDVAEFPVARDRLRDLLSEFELAGQLRAWSTATEREAFCAVCASGVRSEYTLEDQPQVNVRLSIDFVSDQEVAGRRLVRRATAPTGTTATQTLASIWLTPDTDSATDDVRAAMTFEIHRNLHALSLLDDGERRLVEEQLAQLTSEYQAALRMVPAYETTHLVDQILRFAYVVAVTDGADVTFVARDEHAMAAVAAQLVTSLSTGRDDSHLVLVPVKTGTELASYVRQTVASRLHRDIDNVQSLIDQGVVGHTARTHPQAARTWEGKARQLQARVKSHAQVLPAAAAIELTKRVDRLLTVIAASATIAAAAADS